ncbi:hypothetical protein PFISCL1PPCAC_22598, partial [Pristionchus fissidentatus]
LRLLPLLLLFASSASSANSFTVESSLGEHELICRACGQTITKDTSILRKDEQQKISPDYDYEMAMLGVNTTVHVLTNPAGQRFHVLSTRHANVKLTTEPSPDATWYPGKAWSISVCPHCGAHMGWYFTPIGSNGQETKDDFHGIILDRVISAEFCDSMIRIPGGKP